jgi:hypothetical protein
MWKAIADEMLKSLSEVEAMHWEMGENEMARRVALGRRTRGFQEMGTLLKPAEYAQEDQPYLSHEQGSLGDHRGMMESVHNLGMAGSQQMDFRELARDAPPGHQSFLLAPAPRPVYGTSDPQQYAFGSSNRK